MSAKIPTGKNALFKPLFRFMREKRAGREKIRRNLQHWHFTARFRTLAPQTRSSIAEANCGNAWKRALWTGLKIHNASTLNSSVQPIENGDVAFTGNSRKNGSGYLLLAYWQTFLPLLLGSDTQLNSKHSGFAPCRFPVIPAIAKRQCQM